MVEMNLFWQFCELYIAKGLMLVGGGASVGHVSTP